MIFLPDSLRDEMLAHAWRGLPNEACGLFLADPASVSAPQISQFVPMDNMAESSELYQLDGQQMIAVEKEADEHGRLIVGVMHSHTHTTAYPSPTDVRDAGAFDPFGAWHYIIVSLKDAVPVLRSYRIIDGNISEEAVVSTKG